MSENDAKKNKHRFKDIEKTSRESNEQQVCRHMFSQVELKQL